MDRLSPLRELQLCFTGQEVAEIQIRVGFRTMFRTGEDDQLRQLTHENVWSEDDMRRLLKMIGCQGEVDATDLLFGGARYRATVLASSAGSGRHLILRRAARTGTRTDGRLAARR